MKRKFFLLVVASLLIFSLILSSFGAPSQAAESVTVLRYTPTLEVKVIAEDDQLRNTGIIVLGLTPSAGWTLPKQPGSDYTAHYKLLITLNGMPVKPDYLIVQVLNKTIGNPSAKQFAMEIIANNLTDASSFFVGKVRSIDVYTAYRNVDIYYIGPFTANNINDYAVLIQVGMPIGSKFIWGSALTDLCILGWSMGNSHQAITLPDGGTLDVWDNPLGPFVSSSDAALWQRKDQGIGVPSVP